MRKLGEGFLGVVGIALGLVGGYEAGKDVFVTGIGRQALHVIGVVDVRVLRVQADEAISCLHRGFVLIGTIMGIDQFKLRLFGVLAKGVARLQQLQAANRQVKIAVGRVAAGVLIDLLLAGVGGNIRQFVIARAGSEPGEHH